MRKLLVLVAVMIVSLTAMAQTKTGLYVVPTVSTVDVRQNSLVGVLNAELGYFGKVFGIAGTVESNYNLDSRALVGLKGYINVARYEHMSLKGAIGAATSTKDLKNSQWQFKPEVSLSIPLLSNIDARIAGIGTLYSHDSWRIKPGVAFGLALKL